METKGLSYRHMMYFADMLIMANDMQLLHLAKECLDEKQRRRQRVEVLQAEELPRFNLREFLE